MARTLHKEVTMLVRRKRGFTLVELAVVVTIVGVLSVIAVVGYRRLILSSKITEAENMISGIRIAQEQYKSERGIYANIGGGWCPAGAGGAAKKVQWNPACSGGTSTWAALPVHSDGPVQFQYKTEAAASGGTVDNAGFVNVTAADTSKPWYVVQARADLDPSNAAMTMLWGSSFGNQIFSDSVGE